MSFDVPEPMPRRTPVATITIGVLLAFLAGLALMAWGLTRWEPLRQLAGLGQAAPAPPAVIASAPTQVATPEMVGRVAELENRLAAIDTRLRTAATTAGRAESLLIAFAARRAIDRGVGLGYLEKQLVDRFAATQPQAVSAVISAAQRPVTLGALRAELERLAPSLLQRASRDWWQATRDALSSLIVVQHRDTPSADPEERLVRARLLLDAGAVDKAMAEVARLPGASKAAEWLNDARRHAQAQRALDVIEAAALIAADPAAPPAQPAPEAPRAAPGTPDARTR